jgi:methyl-accepting chemotaxis protein
VVSSFYLGLGKAFLQQVELMKTRHLNWGKRLEAMLSGEMDIQEEEAGDHHSCTLGKWYYGEAAQRLADWQEFRQLEEPHQKFHQAVLATVRSVHRGERKQAEASLEQVKRLSGEVVNLLTALEARIREMEGDIEGSSGEPLREVIAGNGRQPI